MKIFSTFALLILPITAIANDIIHPLDFKGSEAEKNAVTTAIKANVKEQYTEIGMGDPLTLRMMEEEELESFKKLTKVTNRKLLDDVIDQYCEIDMCNYVTILMMYNEQKKASSEELEW